MQNLDIFPEEFEDSVFNNINVLCRPV